MENLNFDKERIADLMKKYMDEIETAIRYEKLVDKFIEERCSRCGTQQCNPNLTKDILGCHDFINYLQNIKENNKLKRVGNFEKVSLGQFADAMEDCFGQYKYSVTEVEKAFNVVKIPERATGGSAGYDFVLPVDITLEAGQSATIPTGIRCKINTGVFLMIVPRSGLGFKYACRLWNTAGIVDSDYYYADNEGHVFVKIRNEGGRTMELKAGDRFCQGILLEYCITDFDNATAQRTGGMGSTN